jgi:uncharacterized protein YmfQ (DUF2313 family)
MSRLLKSFQSVLERGAAWAAEIGTNTYHLYESISEVLDFVEARVKHIAEDTDPISVSDTIPEFQQDLGLPRCAQGATEEARRNEIRATYLQRGPFRQELTDDLAELYGIGRVLLSRKDEWHLGIRFLEQLTEKMIL